MGLSGLSGVKLLEVVAKVFGSLRKSFFRQKPQQTSKIK